LFAAQTGTFKTGLKERSFLAFSQGHNWSQKYRVREMPETDFQMYIGSEKTVQADLGYESSEDVSMIWVIKNHPRYLLKRCRDNMLSMPFTLYEIIRINNSELIFVPLMITGMVFLLKNRRYDIVMPMVTVVGFLFVYFFFFFRHGYFLLIYIEYFIFSIIGVKHVMRSSNPRFSFVFVPSLGVSLINDFTGRSANPFLVTAGLTLIIAVLAIPAVKQKKLKPLVVILIVLLMLNWFPAYDYSLQGSQDTMAYKIGKMLETHVGPGNWVASYGVRETVFSYTAGVLLNGSVWNEYTEDEWNRFLEEHSALKAVYLSKELFENDRQIYSMITRQDGRSLTLRFCDSTGFYRIYTVNQEGDVSAGSSRTPIGSQKETPQK